MMAAANPLTIVAANPNFFIGDVLVSSCCCCAKRPGQRFNFRGRRLIGRWWETRGRCAQSGIRPQIEIGARVSSRLSGFGVASNVCSISGCWRRWIRTLMRPR
jgi:hypothetical protein